MAAVDRDVAACNAVESNKTSMTTKKGYQSKIKYIVRYLQEKRNSLVEGDPLHNEFKEALNDSDEIRLPLPYEVIKALFGRLATDVHLPKTRSVARDNGDSDDEGPDETNAFNEPTISKSCMGGYKSALKDYYFSKGVQFEAPTLQSNGTSLDAYLNELIDSYSKTVADKKVRGVMSIKEGRSPVSVGGYEELCKTFLKWQKPTGSNLNGLAGLMCWAMCTNMWSQLARSETIDVMHLAHLDWVNDGMRTNAAKSKKDQGGSGIGKEKMHYANPFKPHACPVLSTGLWLLTKSRKPDEIATGKLFDGRDQKHRYAALLAKILKIFPDAEITLVFGATVEQLGTHSNRKGGLTFLLQIVDGPNPCAVYIRAQWSLGNTQDRYIMGGAGEDELCGRILALLDLNSIDFGVLPPQFTPAGLLRVGEMGGWGKFLDHYKLYPAGIKRCLPFFVASALYHLPKLQEWFPASHPVWGSKMFTTHTMETLVDLSQYVVVRNFSCPETGMTATGIPGWVMLKKDLADMSVRMDKSDERSDERFKQVMERFDTIPEALSNKMSERFTINNMNGVTVTEIKALLAEHMQFESRQFAATIEAATGGNATNSAARGQNSSDHFTLDGMPLYSWGGRYHIMPKGFEFPIALDVRNMWNRWHFGYTAPIDGELCRINPLKRLNEDAFKGDVSDTNQRKRVMKVAKVMNRLSTLGVELGVLDRDADITAENSTAVFDSAFNRLVTDVYGADALTNSSKKRYSDYHVSNYYRLLCNKR